MEMNVIIGCNEEMYYYTPSPQPTTHLPRIGIVYGLDYDGI